MLAFDRRVTLEQLCQKGENGKKAGPTLTSSTTYNNRDLPLFKMIVLVFQDMGEHI